MFRRNVGKLSYCFWYFSLFFVIFQFGFLWSEVMSWGCCWFEIWVFVHCILTATTLEDTSYEPPKAPLPHFFKENRSKYIPQELITFFPSSGEAACMAFQMRAASLLASCMVSSNIFLNTDPPPSSIVKARKSPQSSGFEPSTFESSLLKTGAYF